MKDTCISLLFSSVNDELLTDSHALVLFEEELRTAVLRRKGLLLLIRMMIGVM